MIENKIKNDIQRLKDHFGKRIEKIGLFGSALEKSINDINDIDIVVYSRNTSLEDFKSDLSNLELDFPVKPQKINGTYNPTPIVKSGLHYHIIILDADDPNKRFEEINKGKIKLLQC